MHSFILQDWLSVEGPAATTFTQDESFWLDLSPFQDVVFYVDVRESSGAGGLTPTIAFETSVAKEDALFQSLTAAPATMTPSNTPQIVPALLLSAAVPLARYVRWKITGPGGASGWDATFRVLVVANSPGM